jgi:hypothetical protein
MLRESADPASPAGADTSFKAMPLFFVGRALHTHHRQLRARFASFCFTGVDCTLIAARFCYR